MKKLVVVNGTMGVGKTTTCNKLLSILTPSVYLDGDWCWNMNPFIVTDETKSMVVENIVFVLNNYLKCSEYEYIILSWVIHYESIFDDILTRIDSDYELFKFTLTCDENALVTRLENDIVEGVRTSDIIDRSLGRLDLYKKMKTIKIDVSNISAYEGALKIVELIGVE